MALPIDSPNTPEAVRRPRKTRPPRWFLLVMAAIALLIAAGWWAQRPLARIPLPDGGELVFIDAQYGPEYRKVIPIGMSERLRRFVSWQLRSPVVMHFGTPTDVPTLWLVFERHSGPGNVSITVLDRGEALDQRQLEVYQNAGLPRPRLVTGLRCYPRRAGQIDLRISTGAGPGQDITATIPNPFPLSDIPRWTPEPLPQTRQLGSRRIILEKWEATPSSRAIKPVITIHETGVQQDAFKIEHWLSDATGNFAIYGYLPSSEPVYKIHVTVTPNELYPFPASDYLSFGRTTFPNPGEVHQLKLPPDCKLGAALFVGTGSYRCLGKEPFVEPLRAGGPSNGGPTFRTTDPGIFLFGRGSYPQHSRESPHIMRVVVGTAQIGFPSTGLQDFTGIPQESFGLSHDMPPAGTEGEIQLLFPHPESVDFFAAPPEK